MRRSLLLIALCAASALYLALPARAQDPAALGTILGNSAISQWGSQEGVNTKMAQPLISGGTSMKTLDGATEFAAQLQCPSSRQFLQILAQPVGSGDLGTVLVSQDTNYDGTMDYSFSVASPVSGLCTNGVISCTLGTWTDCKAYQWGADSNGKASLLPTLINILTGCYCINASCGSNLAWNNMATVLRTLGGGVVGAIHGTKAAVITDVKIDGATITYYGQDSANCSQISGTSGSSTAQQYYSNPVAMLPDVESEKTTQSADPTSYYSMLFTASKNLQAETRTCQITRAPLFTWDQNYDCGSTTYTYDTCETVEADPECTLRDETVDQVVTIKNFMPTGLSPQPACTDLNGTVEASCSYTCPGDTTGTVPCLTTPICVVNGYVAACTNGQCPLDSGAACSSAPACIVGGQAQLCQFVNPIVEAVGAWIGGGPAVASENSIRFYYPDTGRESGRVTFAPGISATAAISGDSRRCELPQLDTNVFRVEAPEPVDSIFTYCRMEPGNLTFAVTGAKITNMATSSWCFGLAHIELSTDGQSLYATGWGRYKWEVEGEGAMCELMTTNGTVRLDFSPNHCPLTNPTHGCSGIPAVCNKTCSIQTCLDWWKKSRTYTCTSSSYDFSDIRRRVKTIRDSAAEGGGSASYTDLRKDKDGNWLPETQHTFSMASRASSNTQCTKACKTRKPVFNTDATTGWARSSYTNASTTWCFHYRECANDVCPAGEDEEVVKGCQCINEFAEASSIMQTIRLGAHDMICSDDTKKLLQ